MAGCYKSMYLNKIFNIFNILPVFVMKYDAKQINSFIKIKRHGLSKNALKYMMLQLLN